MNPVVERVAKAIYEDSRLFIRDGSGKISPVKWGQLSTHDMMHWGAMLRQARFAIKAMREPTEAMLAAEMEAVGYLQAGGATAWRAMIDEALR